MKNIFLLFICFLFLGIIHIPGARSLQLDNEEKEPRDRIWVSLNHLKNSVELSREQGISRTVILVAVPLGRLDFREHSNIRLKVEKNGRETLDKPLADYVKSKRRKKKTAQINEDYEGFEKLKISVYDAHEKIKFSVDVLLYIQ